MSVNIKPFIIINGTNSNDITGLMITKLPPISKPAMRVEAEEIDGRDGDIVTELGYSAYDKEIEIGLVGDYDVNDVIAFFNTSGQVVFSNEPDFFYRFAIYNAIDFEKLIRFKTATVTFHVQPFKFETDSNDSVHFNPSSFNITNEGNIYSRPELAIQGSGDVGIAVNGSDVLEIALGENRQAIIIDSEAMNAYGTRSNIRNVDVEINPVQDLHGYDAPWIGGAGKNLVDARAFLNASGWAYDSTNNAYYGSSVNLHDYYSDNLNHRFIPQKEYGVCTVSLKYKCNTSQYQSNKVSIGFHYTDDTWGWNQCGYSETYVEKTFTSNSSKIVDAIAFGYNSGGTVYFKDFMMETGTSATDYAPWENICPITGWDECNLTHFDKNLVQTITNRTADPYVERYTNWTAGLIGGYPHLTGYWKAGTYTMSMDIETSAVNNRVILIFKKASDQNWYYINSNNEFVASTTASQSTNPFTTESTGESTKHIKGTITIPEDIDEIRLGYYDYNNKYLYSNLQIELGTTATAYERFIEETYTKEFEQDGQPVTVFGGVINLTTGLLTILKASLNLTKDLSWTKSSSYQGGYYVGSTAITPQAKASTPFLCSHAKTVTSISEYVYGTCYADNAGYLNFRIMGTDSTLQDWKDYLDEQIANGTPVQICYELRVPIEIQLTAEEIHSFIGENVFWADTGTISDLSYTKGDADISTSGDIVSFEIDARDLIDTVLKNRIVTGNYDNLRLKAGQNQIEVTGDVDVLVLSNFSRWL